MVPSGAGTVEGHSHSHVYLAQNNTQHKKGVKL